MNTEKFNGNPAENFGVARLRKQVINENSYIGGMVTSRLGFDGNYNVAYGIDGIFRLFKDDYLDIKIAQTQDKNIKSNTTSLDPTFFRIALQRRSEQGFSYDALYAYWGKDFNPASGFMFLNNLHEIRSSLQYGWFPKDSKIFNYRTGVDFEMLSRIPDGSLENMEVSPEFEIVLKSGYNAFTGISYRKEGVLEDFNMAENVVVPAGDYSFWGIHGFLNSPRTKKFATMVGFEAGQFYDGNRVSLELNPEFSLSSSFQLSATYKIDQVKFSSRSQEFTNNIARLKLTYMLDTKISASSFVQYNQAENLLITNFRLRYNPKDGNDFYLVFNDLRFAEKINSGIKSPPFLNRTLLLKYTHTFRL
jgi:hypothetical protein